MTSPTFWGCAAVLLGTAGYRVGCDCAGPSSAPDAGGGDAGSALDAGPAFDAGYLPFDQFCDAVQAGITRSGQVSAGCGSPYQPGDLPHVTLWRSLPYAAALAGRDCDGGALGLAVAQLAVSIDAGRLVYDGWRAAACRARGQLGDPAALLADPDSGIADFCQGALVGAVPVGGACTASEECAGDAYCSPSSPDQCAGTCVPRLAVGQACDPAVDLCTATVSASCAAPSPSDGGPGRCIPGSGAGGPCDVLQCQANLVCLRSQAVCAVPNQPAGAPCRSVGDDAPPECQPGLSCVLQPDGGATCVTRAQPGQPCNLEETSGAGLPRCEPCSVCLMPDGGQARPPAVGTCAPLVPVGGSCGADFVCVPGASCPGGTCVPQARRGEACTLPMGANSQQGNCMYLDDYCQASATSTVGICTRQPIAGDRCGQGRDAFALCIDDSACVLAAGRGTCTWSLPGAGQPCARTTTGSTCADFLNCVANTCTQPPADGQPCAQSSWQCRFGSHCVPLDAGSSDAGSSDAGSLDGGSDAGSPDSGATTDSGTVGDAGGPADAGSADGGLADAGPPLIYGICAPTKAPGAACQTDDECASLICSTVTHACVTRCTGHYSDTCVHCANSFGARGLSVFLLYAAVWRRRRRRNAPGERSTPSEVRPKPRTGLPGRDEASP